MQITEAFVIITAELLNPPTTPPPSTTTTPRPTTTAGKTFPDQETWTSVRANGSEVVQPAGGVTQQGGLFLPSGEGLVRDQKGLRHVNMVLNSTETTRLLGTGRRGEGGMQVWGEGDYIPIATLSPPE